MPKRPKTQAAKDAAKPKRPSERRKAARRPVTELMARMAEGPMPDDFGTQLSTYMAHLGRKGGQPSGARMASLSQRRRKAIAKTGAAARREHRKSRVR